jgi:hypothetical protein
LKAQPAEGPFDNPPSGKNLEPLDVVGSLHDVHTKTTGRAQRRDPVEQRASIASVRPDQTKAHERVGQRRQYEAGAVAVLNVGGVYDDADDESQRVDDQVALASADFLARIVTANAPLEVVLTDWLSRIAADGIRSRPSDWRTSPRSLS